MSDSGQATKSNKRKASAYGIEVKSGRTRSKRRFDGSRQPRWETLLRALGLGFVVYIVLAIKSGLTRVFNSTFLLTLPFAVLLLLTSTDFLILTSVNDSVSQLFFDEMGITYEHERRAEAELFKTRVLMYVYLYILIFTLFHWRVVYGYVKSWSHWALLLLCLGFGVFYSIEPIKVATNTVLIGVGLCAAILFCKANANSFHYDAFYKTIFLPMLLLHIASIGIFFLYDTPLLEFLLSSRRYGGLAGNPNTLGASVVLGYWAALALILSETISLRFRILAFVSIPLLMLHVLMSGSGTAVVGLVIVTAAMFWLRILAFFTPSSRQILNAGVVVVVAIVFLASLVSTTPAELYLAFTTSLGKDQSMTGRTVLWEIARDAISQKPYLGWGFDSHATVKSIGSFDMKFNHYHNGFLDTLVAGGFVLLSLVLYNLSRFVRAFLLAFRKDSTVFPLILPLLIVLFLNVSEYSLLRPNSPIWQIYVVAFVLLTYQQKDGLLMGYGRRKTSMSKRSRRRQLRWA